MFDEADIRWDNDSLLPTPGGAIYDGDWVGSIRFASSSNALFLGTNNIDPATGQPPACVYYPASPTTFKLYDADLGTSTDVDHGGGHGRIDYRDVTAPFSVQDTLQDLYGPTGNLVPDGLFDGVDLLPYGFDTLWNATGLAPAVVSRAFGRAVVLPALGVDADVNVVIYDMSLLTNDPELKYKSQYYVGYPWMPGVAPTAANVGDFTVVVCPPFVAQPVRIFGKTAGNYTRCDAATCGAAGPAPAIPGGLAYLTVGPTPPTFASFQTSVSAQGDYDGDSIPALYDKCDTNAAFGFIQDTDHDGVTGDCDLTGEVPLTYPSAKCGGGTVTGPQAGPPYAVNQDEDCDGILNYVDNCPKDYNPLQEDDDSDLVGNLCNPHSPSGPAPLSHETVPGNGSGYFCNGAATGGTLPNVPCDASTNGIRDGDNLCVDQVQFSPPTAGEPAGEAASAPGTSPPGTQPYTSTAWPDKRPPPRTPTSCTPTRRCTRRATRS